MGYMKLLWRALRRLPLFLRYVDRAKRCMYHSDDLIISAWRRRCAPQAVIRKACHLHHRSQYNYTQLLARVLQLLPFYRPMGHTRVTSSRRKDLRKIQETIDLGHGHPDAGGLHPDLKIECMRISALDKHARYLVPLFSARRSDIAE